MYLRGLGGLLMPVTCVKLDVLLAGCCLQADAAGVQRRTASRRFSVGAPPCT